MAVVQSVGFEKFREATVARDLRSDKTLVKAAKNGQSEAASALVERHYPRIYSFLSYQTSGKGTAEDLTQEVFARALGALGTFNGRYQFQPWLIRIAKNLIIDEARKDKHRAAPTDPEELTQMETVPVDADQVWNSISRQLAGTTVRKALMALPPRQRTALILREIEEMSYADIAEILGTNVRGVEGTLRRAKARFRLAASAAEENGELQPTCRRTLRLVALNGRSPGPEADGHLRNCPQCRNKSTTVLSADGLFAVLPALGLRGFTWQNNIAAMLPQATAAGKLSVLGAKISRIFGSVGSTAAPAAPALQIAGAAVVAAALSAGSVTGYVTASRDAQPPTFSAAGTRPVFNIENSAMQASQAPAQQSLRAPSSGPLRDLPAVPQIQAPALVGSVIDLLGAHLNPTLDIRRLPVEGQVKLLDELSEGALSEIARALDLPSGGSKQDLLSSIKQALREDPSLLNAPPASPVPAPAAAAAPTGETSDSQATTSSSSSSASASAEAEAT